MIPRKDLLFYFLFGAVLILSEEGSAADTSSSEWYTDMRMGSTSGPFTHACDTYRYYRVNSSSWCDDLVLHIITKEGVPELHVSAGDVAFPKAFNFVWSSDPGEETLRIRTYDPDYHNGVFHIGVRSRCDLQLQGNVTSYSLLGLHAKTDHPRRDLLALGGPIARSINANTYQWYRFCLPRLCTMVQIDLTACRDPAKCPDYYSWPRMFVSMTTEYPRKESRAWTTESILSESLVLNPSNERFFPGHYYVGVYWGCTLLNECANNATCGPCWNNATSYTIQARITREFSPSVCDAMIAYRRPADCEVCINGCNSSLLGCLHSTLLVVTTSILIKIIMQ